jgi:outer membrane protein OmpA-like peptidoglycan-associated protein
MRCSCILASVLVVLVAALAGGPVRAAAAVERRVTHPNGAAILIRAIDFSADSIVVSATITNPGDREIRLNQARSLVLQDGGHGIYHLNPPAENPELRIPPHAQAAGELVFIGPLAPTARQLTLSSNEGIGTLDNPYDDQPVFRASLPLAGHAADGGAVQASHPDGAVLRVRRIAVGAAGCVLSMTATNGNDRAIRLNQDRSLLLTQANGLSVPAAAPADNPDLVVPPGNRIDAELAFPCQAGDGDTVTLSTNRGTGGSADNPYETLPVFTLQVTIAANGAAAAGPRVSVAPIARSRLSLSAVVPPASAAVSAPPPPRPAPPPASAAAPPPPPPAPPPPASSAAAAPPPARPAAPSPADTGGTTPPAAAGPLGPLLEESRPAPRAAAVAPPRNPAPVGAAQLEAALHATRTDRGLLIVLPADELFGAAGKTLDGAAEPVLATLVELIAATHPREIQIAGHTDGAGTDDANQTLSEQRAHAVAGWLEDHIAKHPPRFVEKGYGRTRPLAPNHNPDGSDNPEGRQTNRRIEIMLRR